MKKSIFLFFFILLCPVLARAQSVEQAGLLTTSSAHSVDETVGLLKTTIGEMGLNVIAEVDHAQAASRNDLELRPTYVLLFGNPQVGTKLMQADQRVGLDLPLRILVWENEEGEVFVSYHDPVYLSKTFQLKEKEEVLQKMQGVLEQLTQKVSGANK
jgi:uncharacterized protein (DUF302 family)